MKRQYDLVVRGAPWRQLSVPHVLTCLQSANKWMAIGALLSGHARAAVMGPTWAAILQHYATAPTDVDIRETAQRLLGTATAPAWRSLPLTDMILFLKRMALYGSMNLEQLRTVAAHLTERDVLPGGVIFREGDLSHELYIIVSGRVDIVQQRTEALHTLATLSAGDFFGDMAVFEDRPRSAGAVAVEPTVLLTLSPEHFRQIVLQDPAI